MPRSIPRRALAYFRPDRHWLLVLLALIGTSTALGLLAAWPMAVLVDVVLADRPKTGLIYRLFLAPLPDGRLGQVVGLALVGLALKLMQDLLAAAQTLVSHQLNDNGLMRIRCDLFRKLQAMHLAYHRTLPQGDTLYRLNADAYGAQIILNVVVQVIVAGVTLGVMTLILGSRSLTLTLIAFSIAPALAVLNVVFGRRFAQHTAECKQWDTRFLSSIQRTIGSISLVQAFGREDHEFDQFHHTVRQSIRTWWRLNRQQIAYNLLVGASFGLGGAAIFGYGGDLVWRDQFLLNRPNGMSLGDLIIFTAYLAMLWGPLCTLTAFYASMQNGIVSMRRVFEVLDRDAVITDRPDARPLPVEPRRLTIDDVTFGYDPDRPVLRHVSATVTPGEMVAFVGGSGGGKSTLLSLLPRFYDPQGGALRLDGHDFRDVRLADLRRHFALVLQEGVILPTTVAENIAYGRPDATFDELRRAAERAGAAEFIDQLPEGYATPMTEGGMNLSGGQRQRLAIARALLTEAPFIVLDEPTSALDAEHEARIMETLDGLRRDRTIILVTHRLSTAAMCDRIYVVHHGRLIEQGTHEQLAAAGGLYASMARVQAGGGVAPAPV